MQPSFSKEVSPIDKNCTENDQRGRLEKFSCLPHQSIWVDHIYSHRHYNEECRQIWYSPIEPRKWNFLYLVGCYEDNKYYCDICMAVFFKVKKLNTKSYRKSNSMREYRQWILNCLDCEECISELKTNKEEKRYAANEQWDVVCHPALFEMRILFVHKDTDFFD
jgi:hypothetical protein